MRWRHVWIRNFLVFRKTWLVNCLWAVGEPVLLLGAIGYGLGDHISAVQTKTYPEFFFLGLLCSASAIVAFFEASYGSFQKFKYQRLFSAQIQTPLSASDIATGELLWAGSKGVLTALGLLVVGTALGISSGLASLFELFFVFVGCLGFASFGLWVASRSNSHDSISYFFSAVVLPMTLLGGTYFPVQDLPPTLRYLAYALPFTHVVELVRAIDSEVFTWASVASFLWIGIACGGLFFLALRRFHARLIQ